MLQAGTPIAPPPLTVPGEQSLAGRWSTMAAIAPDRLAIHSAEASYSFGEADAAAEAVARVLASRPGTGPVALFVDNSAIALVGILALMKAGRVLVVLDRHQPADRLRQVVELAGSTLCLADRANLERAAALGRPIGEVICLEDVLDAPADALEVAPADAQDGPAPVPDGPAPALVRPASVPDAATGEVPAPGSAHDPVSIVFTSGSTGQPKGVVQTHQQFLNEVVAKGRCFELTPADRVGVLLPFGFAAGFSALMAALLNGAGVAVFDPRDRGVAPFAEWVSRQGVTAVHCTPHLVRSLTSVLPPGTQLGTLRYLCTLGEPVFENDVAGIRAFLPPEGSFYNETGSSEMGTLAIRRIRNTDPVPPGQVPAGRPIDNKEVRILRADGSPAAAGEPGDIVVVSDYLSGGYWQDPTATAARFGTDPDGRRTIAQGDLGRLDADGELMMLGRADAAVKIRGYLVEPSEIEAAVLAGGTVRETVVVAVAEPATPTRLVAYVVPDPAARTESPAALRRRLRERLPEYMIPGTIVALSSLPRNERGKVDRRLLPPAPDREPSARPTAQWELFVADIWQRVLGLPEVGLDDDFMALGGDSLTVEEMLAAVRASIDVSLTSTDLLAAPTLREFVARVRQGSQALPGLADVVLLQADGDGTPLFCFAGSGGLALSFRQLARYVRDRPVYAFQGHGLERRAIPDWSVGRSADRCLDFIRTVQPHGPYLFAGHSFGGLLALDIASKMQEAGEEVRLVCLLDTYLPRSMGMLPAGDQPPARAKVAAWRRRLDPGDMPMHRYIPYRVGRRVRAVLAGIVQFKGQRQFDTFFDQGVLISSRHRIRPWSGTTLMVFAENNPNGPDDWDRVLTGPHHYVSVRSEHSSMMRDPHIVDVAAAVRDAITAVESSG